MEKQQISVAVIGGGITGLTTGYLLQKMGVRVTLYEKNASVGGVILSVSENGWLVELGPNTMMLRSQEVWTLLKDLKLTDKLVYAKKQSKNRFIVKNGELTPIPLSIPGIVTNKLLSFRAKLRLIKEPFVAPAGDQSESVASFFGRRLGNEVVEYLIDPFTAGIFAGDPEEILIRYAFPDLYKLEQKYGSLFWGAVQKKVINRKRETDFENGLVTFKKGLKTLPHALAKALGDSLKLNSHVNSISYEENKWTVRCENRTNPGVHDLLIITIPSHRLSKILVPSDLSHAFDKLSGIPYAPVAVVSLGFERSQVSHPLDGFGMLVPKVEPCKVLGTLFSSSIFEGRAPSNHHLLTTFVGGSRYPELTNLSKEERRAIVLDDLQPLLGISGSPVFEKQFDWKNAIPQYQSGHKDYIAKIEQLEQKHPSLMVTGSFRKGVSLPDRIRVGFETANKVELFLKS